MVETVEIGNRIFDLIPALARWCANFNAVILARRPGLHGATLAKVNCSGAVEEVGVGLQGPAAVGRAGLPFLVHCIGRSGAPSGRCLRRIQRPLEYLGAV